MNLECFRFAKGLDPVADAFAGTVYSDSLNASEFHKVFFIIHKGVGATGTSTVTVEADDTNSPLGSTAVPFRYRRMNDTDTPGAVTEAAAAGFTTTAGSSDMYVIEVDCKALAATGFKYVFCKMVESVDSPVVGSIAIFACPRYADHTANITS